MNGFLTVVRRDLRLAQRQGGDSLMAVAFFVLAAALFPFAVGPEGNLLERIGGGVLWATALLAALLSFDRLFQADYDDGNLEQLALAPLPLELVVLAKALAHWLTTGLPLVAVAPVVALLFHMSAVPVGVAVVSLLLGTPSLSLIGALGAALVLGARRGGALLALLVVPLALPVLIFGAGAVEAASEGLPVATQFAVLAAFLLAALALAPWGAAAALRLALE